LLVRPALVPMKISRVAVIVGASLSCFASGAVLFSDDFGGSVVDSSKWNVSLPRVSSSVTENNGSLTLSDGAIMTTVQNFTAPYTLTGSFSYLGYNYAENFFDIALRNNGLTSPNDVLGVGSNYYVPQGLNIFFTYPDYTHDNNNVLLLDMGATGTWTYVAGGYAVTNYDSPNLFSITDNGSTISVELNGAQVFSAADSFQAGNQITIKSGSGVGQFALVDFVQVIPEPSSLLLCGLSTLGLCSRRKRQGSL